MSAFQLGNRCAVYNPILVKCDLYNSTGTYQSAFTTLRSLFPDLNGAEVHELRDIANTADTLGVGLAGELDVGVSAGLVVGAGLGGRGVGRTALAGKTTALP